MPENIVNTAIVVIVGITVSSNLLSQLSEYLKQRPSAKDKAPDIVEDKIPTLVPCCLLDEEEKAYFDDLCEEWSEEPISKYRLWLRALKHIIFERKIVAPCSRAWERCTNTIRGIFRF